MSRFQPCHNIPLCFKRGAVRNGNNVAWMCSCGYGEPLLGTALGAPITKPKPVKCPKCDAIYELKLDGAIPTGVVEIERADS